jgi:hypothetical protein
VFKRWPLSAPRRDATTEGNWRRVGQNEEKSASWRGGDSEASPGREGGGAKSTPSFRVRQREGLQAARSTPDRYCFDEQQRDLSRGRGAVRILQTTARRDRPTASVMMITGTRSTPSSRSRRRQDLFGSGEHAGVSTASSEISRSRGAVRISNCAMGRATVCSLARGSAGRPNRAARAHRGSPVGPAARSASSRRTSSCPRRSRRRRRRRRRRQRGPAPQLQPGKGGLPLLCRREPPPRQTPPLPPRGPYRLKQQRGHPSQPPRTPSGEPTATQHHHPDEDHQPRNNKPTQNTE